MSVNVFAAENNTTSGQCGEGVTWEFDEATGILTIDGSGDMEDYDTISPWAELNVKSVVIDDGVNHVGEYAFAHCNVLEKVTLLDAQYSFAGVETVGDYAFYKCVSLREIEFSSNVREIGESAFRDCSALKSVKVPSNVISLNADAFRGCLGLEKVTIPQFINRIGSNVFLECGSSLEIYYAGAEADWDKISVNSSAIPDNVKMYYGKGGFTSDADGIFRGTCGENLTWAFDDATNVLTISGTGEMSDSYLKSRWIKLEPTAVVISSGVTSIGENAFAECTTIEQVSIPEGITSIGIQAFAGCSVLKEIDIPETVSSIGKYAFQACSSLKKIIIPREVTIVEEATFIGCKSIEELVIPEGVISIGGNAFQDCNSLKTVNIPNGVTKIESGTFLDCENLEELIIPESVTVIGRQAFYGCRGLKKVNIPQVLRVMEDGLFKGCESLMEITIPICVTSIGRDCFSGCESLKVIEFDGDETAWLKIEIAENAIPEGVNTIYKVPTTGVCATGHTVVYLDAVEETCIKSGKTDGRFCSVCNTVFKAQEEIPATGIHNYLNRVCSVCGKEAPTSGKCGENVYWDYDRGTGTLRIAGKGEMYNYSYEDSPDWHLFSGYMLKIVVCEGVTAVGDQAFCYSFNHLDCVEFPKTLKYIGKGALGGMATKELILKSDVESKEDGWYANIGILKVADGVTTVPSGLLLASESMDIPVSVHSMVAEMPYFSRIYYRGTEEQWKQVDARDVNNELEVSCYAYSVLDCGQNGYVDSNGRLELFGIDGDWHRAYSKVVTEAILHNSDWAENNGMIGQGTLSLNSGFSGFTNLKTVTIFPCVQTIMEGAFSNCPSLTEIYFSESEEWWNDLLFRDGSNAMQNVTVYFNHGEHTWGENKVTKEATCTHTGEQTVVCSGCGKTFTETVPALGHSFVKGYCSVCGVEDPDYVDPSWPFADVRDRDWFIQPVLWAKEQNITGGISENKFGPNEGCTRAQVVTFLWAANGKPEPKSTDNPFKDVADDAWYLKPVLWAVEQGITGGVSKDKFGPEQTCTRGQIVTFLYAAERKPAVSGTSTFKDVADLEWFAKPVIWAAENDVTGGIGNGKFGPNDTCTRAQVVTFLYKVYGTK